MATEKVSTIHTTTGNYSDLASWEADLGAAGGVTGADLVFNDEIAVAEIQESLTGQYVLVDGFTTDTTRYVHIRPSAGNSHGGDQTAGFKITGSGTTNGVVLPRCNALITDLVIENSSTVFNPGLMDTDGQQLDLHRCIIISTGASTYGVNINAAANRNTILYNCLIITAKRAIYSGSATTTDKAYNCTAIATGSADYGILRVDTRNCFAYGFGSGDYLGLATGSTNNASSDTTGSAGLQSLTSAEFNNYAGGDYSLASGSNLIDAGTDLSGTFTDDIAGNTRS